MEMVKHEKGAAHKAPSHKDESIGQATRKQDTVS